MVRAPSTDAEDTRERLLEVASHMYQKSGYEATSLRRVAKELGISGPAIYYHFRSKDELLVAAYEERIGRMIDAHKRIQADLEPAANLWTWTALHVHLQVFPGYQGPYMFGSAQLLVMVAEEERAPLYRVMRRYLDELVAIVNQGIKHKAFKKADPNAVAFAIFGMDHHISNWYSPDGALSPAELANLYADMSLRMVGAAPITRRAGLRRLVEKALEDTRERSPA